jgi:hypothetical protein
MMAMTAMTATPAMGANRAMRMRAKASVERNGAKISSTTRAVKRDVRVEGEHRATRRRRMGRAGGRKT